MILTPTISNIGKVTCTTCYGVDTNPVGWVNAQNFFDIPWEDPRRQLSDGPLETLLPLER
jgi:hypothetical protein